MIPEVFSELIKLFGPMGFIMWLVFRTTNHTIPRLAKSFEEALDRQRKDFREMQAEQRSDFRAVISREQDTHKDQTSRIVNALERGRP